MCTAICRDYNFLFQTPAMTGIDGYYYVIQIESIRNSGNLYFSTHTPVVLYLIAGLSFLIQDTVIALKFSAIIMHLIVGVGVLLIVDIATKNKWLSLGSFVIIAFSGLHLYLISEFLSNLGAVAFLVWAIWAAVKYLSTKKRLWLGLLAILLTCAIFSHRSALGLIFLGSLIGSIAYILSTTVFSFRYKLLFSSIFCFLYLLPLILVRQPFFVLPDQMAAEFLKTPRLPLRQVDLAENIMLFGGILTTIFAWFLSRKALSEFTIRQSTISISLLSLLTTLNLFLNHHSGVAGLVGRLGILSYLLAAVMVPCSLAITREFSKPLQFTAGLLFLSLTAMSYLNYFAPVPLSLRQEYLQRREILIRELPLMRAQMCEHPFIVAQHGEEFLVTALLEIPAQQKEPLVSQQCLFWLVHRVPEVNLVGNEIIGNSENVFVLVEDKYMKQTIGLLSPRQSRLLLSANPYLRQILTPKLF